ncbi:MAG TPA: GGDEF domain-containing protein, partial [Acidimicrobiales bacterium]|nr:GGDEF domain-containing protein [Acidimicrobiales bacterium]
MGIGDDPFPFDAGTPRREASLDEAVDASFVVEALAHSYDLIVVTDASLRIRFVSQGIANLLGSTPEDALGQDSLSFFHQDDVASFALAITSMISGGLDEFTTFHPDTTNFHRLRHADGHYVMVEASGGPFLRGDEVAGFWYVARRPMLQEIYADVVSRVLDEQPLADALQRIVEVFSSTIVVGGGCVTAWPVDEPRFTLGSGLPSTLNGREVLPGSPWARAMTTMEPVAVDDVQLLDEQLRAIALSTEVRSLYVVPVPGVDGTCSAFITVWTPDGAPPSSNVEHMVKMAADLVQVALRLRTQVSNLRRSAASDPLTGLANRRALADALDAVQAGETVALLMVDLDRFKAVNDQHGHPAGDTLLLAVARRLERAARSGDLVARIGGDEFAILCRNCDDAG